MIKHKSDMRIIFIALLFLGNFILASEWVVTEGGLSPDQKLAVAVIPQKTERIDETDDSVLLIDQTTGRKIARLAEVFSSGGTWGKTTENVRCVWSFDSTILLVNYRTGRLMHSSQVYRIRDRRAIPLAFPADKTHAKGKFLEGLTTTANPGSEVALHKDGSIVRRKWGYVPDARVDAAKHGLAGFEGELLFRYRVDQQGALELYDISVPSAP
jgi:hypothetical protein